MKHFEDLSAFEIIDLVENLCSYTASIKLDGTCAITFGFDATGKFYTAFGRDFKKVEQHHRKYSIDDWTRRKIIMSNPGIFAHAVLKRNLTMLRQVLPNDEPVVVELLYADQPNCIQYKLGGISRFVVLNHNSVSRAMEGLMGTVLVPQYYITNMDVFQRFMNKSYKFEAIPQCQIPNISISAQPMKDLLGQSTNGIKNEEYILRRAAGSEKPAVLKLREKVEQIKQELKDKLIREFVSKAKGDIEPEAGYVHEGVVLSFRGQRIKLVDKNSFTAMHERDWAPARAAKNIRLQVCREEVLPTAGMNQIQNLLNNFGDYYPNLSKDIEERMKDQLRMAYIEIRDNFKK